VSDAPVGLGKSFKPTGMVKSGKTENSTLYGSLVLPVLELQKYIFSERNAFLLTSSGGW